MAVLRKRRTNRGSVYHVDFIYEGRRVVRSTKTGNLQIAKKILGEIQGQIARGTFKLNEERKPEIRLSAFIVDYLRAAMTTKSEGTIKLERHYLKMFSEAIGDRNLRGITQAHIDKWLSLRSAAVNPTTRDMERRALHAIFSFAKTRGYVDKNPFANIPKVKVQEKRLFMTNDELGRLFQVLRAATKQSRTQEGRRVHTLFLKYVEFMLNTGLRRNEGLELKWHDVDFEKGVIYIAKTKNREMRTVPMNDHSRSVLTDLGEDLFGGLNSNLVTHKFAEAVRRAGLSGFKLHSLRHSFACALISNGVDIYTVSKLLGHSDLKTTMIYAKMGLGTMQSAVDTLKERYRLPLPPVLTGGLRPDIGAASE
jgi:integrase/recombinase XerD